VKTAWTMEFPLQLLAGTNGSEAAAAVGRGGSSLLSREPAVAVPYIATLAVAAVVGTLGNVAVVTRLAIGYLGSRRRRHRASNSGNDAGLAFVANLALSDLIVAALINPLAIAGLYQGRRSHRIIGGDIKD